MVGNFNICNPKRSLIKQDKFQTGLKISVKTALETMLFMLWLWIK